MSNFFSEMINGWLKNPKNNPVTPLSNSKMSDVEIFIRNFASAHDIQMIYATGSFNSYYFYLERNGGVI